MQGEAEIIMAKKTLLSATELKRIIIDIKEHGPDTCIRFRLIGEMWQVNMMRIITVTENRVLIHDGIANRLLSIDLNNVMQFEIDTRFQDIQPHYHYEVKPVLE